MQYTCTKHYIERTRTQTRMLQISFNKLHASQSEALNGCGAELQRGSRHIRADDQAFGAREIQTHLSGPATYFDDPRVSEDSFIQQSCEATSFSACV